MQHLQDSIVTFEAKIDKSLQDIWEGQAEIIPALCRGLQHLLDDAIGVGDAAMSELEKWDNKTTEPALAFVTIFEWSDHVKSFFKLWRDVILQISKGAILEAETEVTEAQISDLRKASRHQLTEAADTLRNLAVRKAEGYLKNKRNRQLERWKHQHNPWPIYRSQFQELREQTGTLSKTHRELKRQQHTFDNLRSLISVHIETVRSAIEANLVTAQEAKNFVEDHLNGKPQKIASHLDDVIESLRIDTSQAPIYENFEVEMEKLSPELQIYFLDPENIPTTKNIDFRAQVRKWLETEILPSLYELSDFRNQFANALKNSTLNIKNRALILAQDSLEQDVPLKSAEDLVAPLARYLEKSEEQLKTIKKIQRTIRRRLELRFNLERIYDPQQLFLSSPFQRVLSPIDLQQNSIVQMIRNSTGRLRSRVLGVIQSIEKEDALSDFEKITRYVDARSLNPTDDTYTHIFKNKDFIGESFCVGRERELSHIKGLIERWRRGTSASVLLRGARLSGRSLFGEMVSNRFFPKDTLRVAPVGKLIWQGRTLELNRNMHDLFEFISKHGRFDKTLLWIDDLEMWQSPEITLAENIEQLNQFVSGSGSQHVFTMVALSDWVFQEISRRFQLDQIFHAHINLNRMALEEVESAIAIRHGATHKNLVDEAGNKVSVEQFHKMISRVYRWSRGNIGEALHQWAISTHVVDEDNVTFSSHTEPPVPDFFDGDAALVLDTIIKRRQTNEYALRKIFGPAFNQKFSIIILRLINLKILQRDNQGMLSVNEDIINTVIRNLREERMITSSQS